jgi:LL-diaminopimelate aminotransferase
VNSQDISDRLKALPPYVFSKIAKVKEEQLKLGKKLIGLGMGDPDLPTPDFILERMSAAIRDPKNHGYPGYVGKPAFRQAVARWMKDRFGVEVNPDGEVLPVIGTKEGIAHLPLAFVNPGESTLVPDPAYPVYEAATVFAGGTARRFALLEKNGYLPDFAELEKLVKQGGRTRILFLNYPNNPTAGTATVPFFKEVVAFAKKHDVIVCHDNAYSEIYFEGKKQPSFLEAPGAKDVGIEFQSFSKTFNMAGWRIGFVAGNARIIEGLAQIETNVNTGLFNAVQDAAIAALEQGGKFCDDLRGIYQKRRDMLVPALRELGLKSRDLEATFYVWARLPEGSKSSEEYVMDLIRRKGIVSTPGSGFGNAGEGYVRFTLCSDIAVLKQVAEALRG